MTYLLALAAHRTELHGFTNVSFIEEDVDTVRITDEFDAVVGRLILLYLPEPARLLGPRLDGVMRDAGFDDATVLGLQSYRPPADPDGARLAAMIIRTLLPVLEETGIATAEEIDIETLEDRVRRECVRHNAIFKPPTLVGAWARVA